MSEISKIWERIFAVGRERGYSKETCRKMIEKRMLRLRSPNVTNRELNLEDACREFIKHDKPLWMESVESLVSWKKNATKRCCARLKEVEVLKNKWNKLLEAVNKKQVSDTRWIRKLEVEIARKIGVPNPQPHMPEGTFKVDLCMMDWNPERTVVMYGGTSAHKRWTLNFNKEK